MRVPSNNPKYVCRKCKAKIHTEDLEAIYRSQLENFLLSEEHIAEYMHTATDSVRDKMEQLEVLQKEQKSPQLQIDKTYDLYMKDKISADGFGVKCKPLEERLAQLKDEVPKRQSELDLLKIDNLATHSVLDQTTDLAQRWDQMSNEEQFAIVESITESIVVKEGEIDINFHTSLLYVFKVELYLSRIFYGFSYIFNFLFDVFLMSSLALLLTIQLVMFNHR
ncbi:MAG: hypothetical protein AB8B89_06475 [Gammaproteobacteria bacterium]